MSLAGVAPEASTATVVGRSLRSWLLPLGIFFGALLVWELLTRLLGLPQFVLPAPSRIAEAWVTYLPELWSSATYTLVEILLGMVIGCVAGIVCGRPDRTLGRRCARRCCRSPSAAQRHPHHRLRAAHQQLVRPRHRSSPRR